MPKYAFECKCGLHFTRTLKTGNWPSHPCPACFESAPLVIQSFGFAFAAGKGDSDANTGVHKHDYPTADVAAGRSSDSRWEVYQERHRQKVKLRRQAGSVPLMRRDGDGYTDYTVMPAEVKVAHDKLVDRVVEIERQPVEKVVRKDGVDVT